MLIAAYFIETGLLLIAAPWTVWWRNNFFADMWPWLGVTMASRPAHIAVVLAGVMTLVAGTADLWNLFRARRDRALTGDHVPIP